MSKTARLVSLEARVLRDLELLETDSCPADGSGYWVGRRSLASWPSLARRQLEREMEEEDREFLERRQPGKRELQQSCGR